MISLWLLIAHFVGDFLLQSNWMALNKSKRLLPLLTHCLVYAVCFLPWGLSFVAITFVLHFLTDYWTSKATSGLWFIDLTTGEVYERKRHWFFVMIGFDQLLHAICLHAALRLVQ